ncbi:unnamed protein product [Nesidiocoris tenuis]|uniref:Uncharacterized protein n=1 Tax=Nesidiocoris tenuis TaxID=355587 RepID=A0A6H5G531_9HEMI|nr:unnamed protein product [Nesidiocoris tenuis]
MKRNFYNYLSIRWSVDEDHFVQESGHDRQHPHRYSLPFDAFCHEHDTIDHQFQYYRSYLLLHYKFRGTLLILSGLSLNTFVGASLFQPVKWHMKTVESKDEKEKPLLNNGNTIKEEDEEEEGGLTLLAPGAENVRDTCDRETSPPKSSIVNHQRTGQSSIKRQNSLVINNLKPPVDSNAQPRKIFQVNFRLRERIFRDEDRRMTTEFDSSAFDQLGLFFTWVSLGATRDNLWRLPITSEDNGCPRDN